MRNRPAYLVSLVLASGLLLFGAPAAADHSDPFTPLSGLDDLGGGGMQTFGDGEWEFIRNFRSNPGTDLKFFRKNRQLYSSSGTLGQADAEHVGQRILRLVNRRGRVNPKWIADHGSAHCTTANPGGTTGLQHDAAVTGRGDPQLLIDTTDATGRCHDFTGGGLELIDISRFGRKNFEPREIHLTRHNGTSHTVTVDATRPWIVYNSSSQFAGANWIDVLNVRSCLGRPRDTLEEKRDRCRPKVYRIPFEPEWSQARGTDGNLRPGTEATCHDITSTPGRIYCAALNATLIFDVSDLTDSRGRIRGERLPCPLEDATGAPGAGPLTTAKVTNCAAVGAGTEEDPTPQAEGWRFLGTFNHPGRDCGGGSTTCNSNLLVPATEGIAVNHESDPSPDGRYVFATDERGGGVVPPGASCEPGVDNPFGNGGIHVFDVRNPSNIQYAMTPADEKAVFIGDVHVPAQTFCTVHVIQHVPREQRLIVAYYTQGTKIVDYFIDGNGRWTFRETASLILPNANTWTAHVFKRQRNDDGTRTYFIMASDIERGIDIFTWTGRPNPVGSPPPRAPASPSGVVSGEAALLPLGLALLPLASRLRRRRLT